MRLALCQMNAAVGDIDGNAERIRAGRRAAAGVGAQLVLFPELALTGYPPEDLLLREDFLTRAGAVLEELAREASEPVAVVGFPERAEDVYNAAAVLAGGRVHAVYRKVYLPNYGVFDEQRYFQAGDAGGAIDIGYERVGLTVCEDIWEPGPPASEEALAGATLIVNISASPYHAGKGAERERMFAQRARDNLACVAFCALVGGQDELVFDGHSFVVDHAGQTIARAAQFREELLVCDVDLEAAAAARLREAGHRPAARSSPRRHAEVLPAVAATGKSPPAEGRSGGPLAAPLAPEEAEVSAALQLGLRDYAEKNGLEHVVLGLSGGVDSALVACIASDTLGSARVSAAVMPSPYSSAETQADARALAAALGLQLFELPIAEILESYMRDLAEALGGGEDRSAGPAAVGAGGPRKAAGGRENSTATSRAASPSSRTCQRRSSTACATGATRPRRRSRAAPRSRSPTRSCSARPRRSCAPASATRTRCRRMTCWTASCTATSSATTGASS